jgi:cellulose synthase/poly-beta-1,6-N-acetylglucosamine synthase-like glycosyltransferase
MTWRQSAEFVLVRLDLAILVYFFIVNTAYGIQLLSAAREMWEHTIRSRGESRWRLLGSRAAPRISIVTPAHNEAETIVASVQALLALHYPNLEVVVVNDGSKDATLDVLRAHYELSPIHPIYQRRIASKPVHGLYWSRRHPNLLVVDKANGGKADAQNAGLNLASGEFVCVCDADTLIEPDALLRMVKPLMEPGTIAVGGTIRVANGSVVQSGRVIVPRAPRRALAGFQTVEYLRAFLFGRLGWNRLGGNMIISGAFGLFRRETLLEARGYDHNAIGEDMELITRLRRRHLDAGRSDRVVFIPDPVAWTQAPESARSLGGQRDRWHRGLCQVLWGHRQLLFNARYRALGLIVYPFFLIVEGLAPVVEAIGLVAIPLGLALGLINVPFAILYLLVAYGYTLVLTVLTLVLEELNFHKYQSIRDRLWLLLWTVLEPFGYRQMTVFWRLRGLMSFLRGRRDWGKMQRQRFDAIADRRRTTQRAT